MKNEPGHYHKSRRLADALAALEAASTDDEQVGNVYWDSALVQAIGNFVPKRRRRVAQNLTKER